MKEYISNVTKFKLKETVFIFTVHVMVVWWPSDSSNQSLLIHEAKLNSLRRFLQNTFFTWNWIKQLIYWFYPSKFSDFLSTPLKKTSTHHQETNCMCLTSTSVIKTKPNPARDLCLYFYSRPSRRFYISQ